MRFEKLVKMYEEAMKQRKETTGSNSFYWKGKEDMLFDIMNSFYPDKLSKYLDKTIAALLVDCED